MKKSKKKNILIFSQHFWPINFRINEIAIKLTNDYNVYVVSSWPTYNNNKKFKNINDYSIQKYKKINILRVPTYKRDGSNISVILNYVYFIYYSIKISKYFKKKKFNLILSYATSPIYQSFPAISYAKKNRAPLVIWVQDMWPDILIDLGYLTKGLIYNCLKKISQQIYNSADYLLAQSSFFKNELIKSYNIKKIETLNNSYKQNKKFNTIKINKKIYRILYAGNIGKAQSFKEILNQIKNSNKKFNIELTVIGNGSEKEKLKQLIKTLKLSKKVNLINQMNSDKLEKYYKNHDAFFISLKEGLALSSIIPGKFAKSLSFGKPIIALNHGILKDLINKYKIGFTIDLNKNLQKEIEKINNPNYLKRINTNCQKLLRNNFDINLNYHKLKKIIKKVEI